MNFNRRDFIKLGAAQAAIASIPRFSQAEGFSNIQREEPSVLQGATDSTQTQFSIVFDSEVELSVYAVDEQGNEIKSSSTKTIKFEDHEKSITRAFFRDLIPSVDYQLLIKCKKTHEIIDERIFRTLSKKINELKFAMCSCMDHERHKPEIWQELVKQEPDVIFFIGDSVYADRGSGAEGASPKHLWKKFCEARATLEIYFSRRLVPIVAVWDDHDFGRNDSDSSYIHISESQKSFLTFFAQEESCCEVIERGPGVSSRLIINGHQIFLMDCRSFRAKRGSDERFAHWGESQERWMLQHVERFEGPTWIMTGSQIFPHKFWKESMSRDHKNNFESLQADLKKINSKVIFASGDVHYSEISKINKDDLGYQTYEVTSSSMHSAKVPGVPELSINPRRIESEGSRNFVIVESKAVGKGAQFEVRSVSSKGEINFARQLEV